MGWIGKPVSEGGSVVSACSGVVMGVGVSVLGMLLAGLVAPGEGVGLDEAEAVTVAWSMAPALNGRMSGCDQRQAAPTIASQLRMMKPCQQARASELMLRKRGFQAG